MKNCKKLCVVALMLLVLGQFLAPKEANAQVIEVGVSGGLSYYMGDINPRKPFNQSRLGYGLLVRYYDNTRWAFRLAYSNLQLEGSDESANYRAERGLSFTTNVHDIALVAEFNFLDYFTGSKRSYVSPYIFGGISVLNFTPKAKDGTKLCTVLTDVDYDKNIPENGNKKYSTFAASIPFGIGVKYSAGTRIGVALEWRMDFSFTDWLDDCHAYYPLWNNGDEPYVQYSDPTGYAADSQGNNTSKYVQRGNPENNDCYGYLNFSVIYKFNLPKNKDCDVGADKKYYKYY